MTNAEIDRLLAENVLGWFLWNDKAYIHHWQEDNWDNLEATKVEDWHPTTNLTQAFQVVEKMRELGWSLTLIDCGEQWEALYDRGEENDWRKLAMVTTPAPAEAICRAAALAAVGGEE